MDMTDKEKRNFQMDGNKKYILEFFPEEYILLQNELNSGLHPKLEPILAMTGPEDIDMKLAHTAAYCGVVLKGDYTLEDRIGLCKLLYEKLQDKRERPPAIILSS